MKPSTDTIGVALSSIFSFGAMDLHWSGIFQAYVRELSGGYWEIFKDISSGCNVFAMR